MATTATLTATPRTETGKGVARKLRQDGQVPAVVYGHGREPQSLTVPARELGRLLERTAGETTVVELAIDGRSARTLIREVQRHPFRKQILHVDFQELVAGEMITVRIPVNLMGTPEGVRSGGGVMDQSLRELTIAVDPGSIPNHIDVDVSRLTIGHSLHVSDVQLPAGARVLDDPDATIVSVHVTREAAAETAVSETSEPEVLRAKKADETK